MLKAARTYSYIDACILHKEKYHAHDVPPCWNLRTMHAQRHSCVVPFLLYIKSEGKHVERMAVRAKYMTLVSLLVGTHEIHIRRRDPVHLL